MVENYDQANSEELERERFSRIRQKQFEFERKQAQEKRLAVEEKSKKIKKSYWKWIIILGVLIILIGLVYVFQIL